MRRIYITESITFTDIEFSLPIDLTLENPMYKLRKDDHDLKEPEPRSQTSHRSCEITLSYLENSKDVQI